MGEGQTEDWSRATERGIVHGHNSIQRCDEVDADLRSSLTALADEVRRVIEVADREYAEAKWFCNKCGFYGRNGVEEPGTHPGPCPYLAAKVPSGWAIYNMLAPLRGMVDEPDSSTQGGERSNA